MSVMDQAPEVSGEDLKDTTRELRMDHAAVEVPANITPRDTEDLAKLDAAPEAVEPDLDDRQQKIAIARATAEQASASMENVIPGSDTEKQNLQAMREARRTGSMTVDGLQSAPVVAPAEVPATSANMETPALDQESGQDMTPDAAPVVQQEEKKGFISRGVNWVEKRLGGGEK